MRVATGKNQNKHLISKLLEMGNEANKFLKI